MKPLAGIRAVTFDLFVMGLMFVIFSNLFIACQSQPFIESSVSRVPKVKVGLLLGTSKLLRNGYNNAYFFNRIDAAVALYKSGKIKYILVSGDNGSESYNEPQDMKEELMLRGIPASAIYLDFAGFRTLDSVVRAKKIFGQASYIVISQEFHNERAVFIARKMGIEAYGFNAEDVKAYMGFKTKVREVFARTKVFVDFLFGVEPKFLGEKVEIG